MACTCGELAKGACLRRREVARSTMQPVQIQPCFMISRDGGPREILLSLRSRFRESNALAIGTIGVAVWTLRGWHEFREHLCMPKMQTSFTGLVSLLAKNLYTSADVFIRELVQNAHDGCQRRLAAEPN